jgi:hypothetical protein
MHREQMQTLFLASGGTDARSAAVGRAALHQQGDSLVPLPAIAHAFGSPQSGQRARTPTSTDMTVPRRCR